MTVDHGFPFRQRPLHRMPEVSPIWSQRLISEHLTLPLFSPTATLKSQRGPKKQVKIQGMIGRLLTNNKQGVDVYGGVWCGLHLLEYCEGGLVVGPQLEDVSQVEGRLLEVAVRLQDLPQLRWKQSAGRNHEREKTRRGRPR